MVLDEIKSWWMICFVWGVILGGLVRIIGLGMMENWQ